MPKISVIVPVYNASSFLRRCVDSLLAQTFDDMEIILVNDGSTDDSMAIIKEYTDAYEYVIAVSQHNLGLGAARNTGLRASRGSLVTFVDADDCVAPDMLEALYEPFRNDRVDISICQSRRVVIDAEGKKTILGNLAFPETRKHLYDTLEVISGITALQIQLDMASTIVGTAWGKLIRRSLFDCHDVAFPEQHRFSEDAITCVHLYLHARGVALVHRSLYEYVQTGSSLTASYSLRKAEDLIVDMREARSAIETAHVNVYADNFYLANMFSAGKQVQWSGATKQDKKAMRRQICGECEQFKPDFGRKEMPLLYRLEAQISFRGLTPVACSIIKLFRWLPFVKRML